MADVLWKIAEFLLGHIPDDFFKTRPFLCTLAAGAICGSLITIAIFLKIIKNLKKKKNDIGETESIKIKNTEAETETTIGRLKIKHKYKKKVIEGIAEQITKKDNFEEIYGI